MIENLGRVLTVLAMAEANEIAAHADVDAWHAPGECHGLVARNERHRYRLARRHAEAMARRPMRVIIKEARMRGGVCVGAGPRWEGFVGRIYDTFGLPY